MFIDNKTFEQIALATGIPYSVYYKNASRWNEIKRRRAQKMLERIQEKTIEQQAVEFVDKGLYLLNVFLDNCINRKVDLSAKDMKLISDSIANLHRIKQLETGEPTSIDLYKEMNPEELRSFLLETYKDIHSKHSEFIPQLPSMTEKGDDTIN